MTQTVKDGIGDRRIPDLFMPVFDRKLAGNDFQLKEGAKSKDLEFLV